VQRRRAPVERSATAARTRRRRPRVNPTGAVQDGRQALTQLQSARQKLEQLTGAADPKSTAEIKSALAEANSARERSSRLLRGHVRLWRQSDDAARGVGKCVPCDARGPWGSGVSYVYSAAT
jgi:hypothetical protein